MSLVKFLWKLISQVQRLLLPIFVIAIALVGYLVVASIIANGGVAKYLP